VFVLRRLCPQLPRCVGASCLKDLLLPRGRCASEADLQVPGKTPPHRVHQILQVQYDTVQYSTLTPWSVQNCHFCQMLFFIEYSNNYIQHSTVLCSTDCRGSASIQYSTVYSRLAVVGSCRSYPPLVRVSEWEGDDMGQIVCSANAIEDHSLLRARKARSRPPGESKWRRTVLYCAGLCCASAVLSVLYGYVLPCTVVYCSTAWSCLRLVQRYCTKQHRDTVRKELSLCTGTLRQSLGHRIDYGCFLCRSAITISNQCKHCTRHLPLLLRCWYECTKDGNDKEPS